MSLVVAACSSGSTQPPPASVTGIGPEGGTVVSPNGHASLIVPAGALASRADVRITEASGLPLDPAQVLGSDYVITPSGVAFALPATVVIRYDDARRPSGVPEAELQLGRLVSASAWQAITSVISVSGDSAVGSVSTGGAVAVRWPGPLAPCAAASSRQFDFYAGRWAFSAPNSFPGTDVVTVHASGCYLYEDFVDAAGVHGASISLYDAVTAQWHQTYVDSQGGRLVLRGALVGGTMLLYESPTIRYGWTVLSPTQLRYYQERSTNGGATWTVAFDGRYTTIP